VASRIFFDGALKASNDLGDTTPVEGSYGGPGNRSGLARAALDGSDLAKLYPRVVFLQDVFTGRASDETADYVQKLVDAGVHVVFLTWRAQKGPDSAEEVLLDRVKMGRTNPVIVVSHNGGKIAPHSRAQNPTSIIQDAGAFKEGDITAFKEIVAVAAKSLQIKGELEQTASPSEKSAFSYLVRIPNTVTNADLSAMRGKLIRSLNSRLDTANLPYKMQAHPSDPRVIMAQSMPLRFSMRRVLAALDKTFAGEQLPANSEKWLILSDSRKSPKFTKSFPKGAEIQVVRNGGDVENVVGAVLGNRKLKAISVKLGKLRQFVEYWEPSRQYIVGENTGGGGSGGGVARGATDRVYSQKFAMFTGSVMYQLMAWFYEQVWRGQHKLTSLKQLEIKLHQMWVNPAKNGVYVNKQLALLMHTSTWRAMSRGYLNYAQAYLRNFWFREFGDYSAAANHVMENFVGLATDRKSLITLNFKSPSTGRLYKIFTRIPRVMKLDTAHGRVLTAHAYRTGKETPDDGEALYAKTLAMALLVGHGRKGEDGKWHHGSPNGPVLAKLEVQFEYRSSNRVWTFNADELLSLEDDGRVTQGPIVQELTSTLERMEADEEYQAYYAAQEEKATKEDLKKNTRGPSKKNAAARKKTATGRKTARVNRKKGRK